MLLWQHLFEEYSRCNVSFQEEYGKDLSVEKSAINTLKLFYDKEIMDRFLASFQAIWDMFEFAGLLWNKNLWIYCAAHNPSPPGNSAQNAIPTQFQRNSTDSKM